MRAAPLVVQSLGLLLFTGAGALGALGCSGGAPRHVDAGADTAVDAATTQAETPDATPDAEEVRPPSSDECLEILTYPDAPEQTRTLYTRKTWDPSTRILTAVSSRSPRFEGAVSTLKWRYLSHGRVVAYLGVEQPFQHDYLYDEHENVTEFRLSYPERPDPTMPSSAGTWSGVRYTPHYDGTGRLTDALALPLGSGAGAEATQWTYVEDAAGRCIERSADNQAGTTSKETRTYDAQGLLARIDVSQDAPSGPFGTERKMSYDERGRMVREEYATTRSPFPGVVTTTYAFEADGSQTITVDDQWTDVLSDRHRTRVRSAACATIDADIGARADQHCRTQ